VYYVVGCRGVTGLVRMTYWRWSAAFSLAVQGKPDRQALNFRQTKIRTAAAKTAPSFAGGRGLFS
jgi:hypothetical protein